jgi:hypothetical protein
MRWQTTAVLALLLAGAGSFYYVWEVRLGPAREEREARRGRFVAVQADAVREVLLERPTGERVRLVKGPDGWDLHEPVRARADQGVAEGLVATLATARVEREIAANPSSLADYELDRPAVAVTLALADGRQVGMLLGARNPAGTGVYAQERGRSAVVLLPAAVWHEASRPVAELRDRRVLAFEPAHVAGFEIVTPEETLAAEPAEGFRWNLTRPRALRADAETIREFLDKLSGARVKEFVADHPRSLGPYGLEHPVRVVLHVGPAHQRTTRTLLLGNVERGRGVYAVRPGEPSVLLLPEEVWAAVPRTTAALRDKTVVEFERDEITRVELESPRGGVTLVREGGRWVLSRPEALPADQGEVGGLLLRLRSLRAQGFVSEDAAGIARYLARPAVRVTLGRGTKEPLVVLFAPASETRGGRAMAYAAVAGRGPVALVDADVIREVSRSPTELRDRTLLPGLAVRDVARVRLTRGGVTVVVERRGEGDWRFVEGGRGLARATAVESVVDRLRALKWKAIVAEGAQDLARWGLERPVAELTLLRGDGTVVAALLVGSSDGDRVYVKTKAAPTVYAVDRRALDLPRVPEDLRP